MNRWLFLPESAIRDLELLSSLDGVKIAAFIETIESDDQEDRFGLALQLAQIIGITDQAAVEFLTFWEYVRKEQRSSQKSADAVIREIVDFLTSRSDSKSMALADKIASKRDSLLGIFGDFPRRDLARQVRRLEMGPLPHVHAVESVCDIRPVFDRGSERVSRFIPLVTMRIAYHDSCDEHRELIVQLTEEGLEVFEEDLKRVRRRLEAVRTSIVNLSPPRTINEQT